MKENTVSEVAVKKLQGSISSKKSKVLKDVFLYKNYDLQTALEVHLTCKLL